MNMCLKKLYQIDDTEDNLKFDIEDFKDIQEILKDDDEEYSNYMLNDSSPEPIKFEVLSKKDSKYELVTRRIDSGRIRHKTIKNIDVYTSQIKNVKMTMETPSRSGVIIYTHFKGKTYFCLGIDSNFGDLTDFGGGMKKNETFINCGLRELEEESKGVFGEIKEEEIQSNMGVYSKNMMIMFIYRNVDMVKTKKDFKPNNEVSNIEWIETKDFIDIISGKGKRMYSRVRRVLQKVTDIICAL